MGATAVLVMACVTGAQADGRKTESTLKLVQDRGYVQCGVTDRVPGFSIHGANGQWTGFYVDFCRAVGAAVLGDANAIQIDNYWLDALEGGDIDILHAGSTWTFSRDTQRNIDFPNIYFFDGQGFIAHAQLGAKNLKEAMAIKGVRVCAIGPTSTARANLEEFIEQNQVKWTLVPLQTMDGMWRAFFGGRCQMAIHDRSALAAVHAGRLDDSDDFVVFPEVISKEPLAPAVRGDDTQWRDLVSWVTLITIAAEELNITSDNVDDMRANSNSPEVLRLLGVEPGLGKGFGLDDEWAYRVIKQLGNYAEIFARNIGSDSPFRMPRGMNSLWRDGGLLYAPPIR
ncbi:MAG: amino acid ABC transporter substrate-binding protein [Magnetovibrio sp.]|nr:amino acid ABC transporter substrate-binding protein [Magnetovibrio sp.]